MDPHHFPRLTFCITPSGSLDWIVPKELLKNNEDSACLPVGNLSGGHLILFGTFQTSTTYLKSPPKLLWSSVIYGKDENTSSDELDSAFFFKVAVPLKRDILIVLRYNTKKSCSSFERYKFSFYRLHYEQIENANIDCTPVYEGSPEAQKYKVWQLNSGYIQRELEDQDEM